MPKAGPEVSRELKIVCSGTKCINLNNWLNELYFFRKEYNVYRETE